VTFGVDHIVSGVAVNIIATGSAGFLAELLFSGLEGGGPTQSPSLPKPPTNTIPGISDAAASLEDNGWFVISDLAAVIASLTRQMSVVTLLAIALLVATAWILWHTPFGLRLRSCGENPQAAETLGVNVYRYKFVAVVISGALAGLGGSYLAMVASSGYSNGQTLGLGYIGLAAMIFGNWRPGGLMIGALLFGYTYAARLRSGGESVHAILLLVAIALLVFAIYQASKRIWTGAAISGVVGLAALWWFLTTDEVSSYFTEMTPYVATLVVLAVSAQSLRMPAADGQIYRRGTAG
jgi:simple sugar transport system permease protein